ncbi:MAG TPA: hypothetical protein VNM16_06185 [Bacillota bacterium]|nr:hypothetical protein [Bacillota bacterium]
MTNPVFWRLGWQMARRAMSRSALAAISLAIATLVGAFSLTIDTGRPGVAALSVRRYLGGDILVQVPAVAAPGVALPAGGTWTWQPPSATESGPLAWFTPDLAWEGAPTDQATAGDVAAAAAVLARSPDVATASPLRALPAMWAFAPGRYAQVEVVARDPAVDAATGFAGQSLVAGRYFLASEATQPVALVDGYRPALTTPADLQNGYARDNGRLLAWSLGRPERLPAPALAPGAEMALQFPTWRGGQPDWSQLRSVGLRVVGDYAVPDGEWNWQSQTLTATGIQDLAPANARPDQEIEPADWSTGTVLVPAAYWTSLAAQVGWKAPDDQGTWILRLRDGLAQVNQVAASLQRALPAATVASIPDLAAASMDARDPAVAIPAQDASGAERGATPSPPPAATPPWIGRLTAGAGYLVAVLLFAGNLYVVVVNRRREVAGLLAAGASIGEIAALLGAEIGAVAALGAACGLALAIPILTWQTLSNGLGIPGLLGAWGRLLAVVLGGVVPLTACALGLATLWAARLPVLAVLRGG